MKFAQFLFFIAIIYAVESTLYGFTDKYCSEYLGTGASNQAYSRDFCKTLAISDSDNKCCYVKYKDGDNTYFNCVELTQTQFYNIKDYKKSFGRGTVKEILCDSSSYINASLFLLLIAFIF